MRDYTSFFNLLIKKFKKMKIIKFLGAEVGAI